MAIIDGPGQDAAGSGDAPLPYQVRGRSVRGSAIIAAAGSSQRMRGTDKLFTELAGSPVLYWVIEAFQNCGAINEIVLVVAKENVVKGRRLVFESGWSKVSNVCPGGPRRQDSVREGLRLLGECDVVAIHDGARPCLTADLIERGIAEAAVYGAAIAGVPVIDTIKKVNAAGEVTETLDRGDLWLVQTPQVFKIGLLREAHEKIQEDVTDDATLVEHLGHKVNVYMGSYQNIKITTVEDLAIAEAILRKSIVGSR